MSTLKYNERSWAIDLISEINLYCSNKNRPIVRAGGEQSLTNKKKQQSLFPDVLLFGDSSSGLVRHGWELKMPDTASNDSELISNASEKANRLNVDSFLSWNVSHAILFKKDENNKFISIKEWERLPINSREDVQSNEGKWKQLLHKILDDLNDFFENGRLKSSAPQEIISEHLLSDFIGKYSGLVSQNLSSEAKKRASFDAEVNLWWTANKNEYLGQNKFPCLSRVVLTNWINKLLFSHYLKSFNSNAKKIESIISGTSVPKAIEILEEITNSSDFLQVYKAEIGYNHIGNEAWDALCDFNQLLNTLGLENISQSQLHKVIEKVLSSSKRKIAGQYPTPEALAKYLAGITIENRSDIVLDPCCGTGTIPKAVYDLKRSNGISVSESLKTVWASDKFQFPLQLCTIALADPEAMGEIVRVFQSDVFDLKVNKEVTFTDPNDGSKKIEAIPLFSVITSNLPFVRFEDIMALNPNCRSSLEEVYGDIPLAGKTDLLGYIALYLRSILKDDGVIGLITSNSWLGADWGKQLRDILSEYFSIRKIIISGNGIWFDNADVVTTILILDANKHQKPIDFITTLQPINSWSGELLDSMISETIADTSNLSSIRKIQYTADNIAKIEETIVGWSSLFSDISWVTSIQDKLIKVSKLFEINRGERRGWDEMFFPKEYSGIESEFIKPVLKSSKNVTGYIAEPEGKAFCCSVSIEELKSSSKDGALEWILRFENESNTDGKPLPETLKRSNHYWYEMKPETLADFIVTMNPDKKLFIARMSERSFVNQRLIRFTAKETVDLDISHALLNSTLGMLFIETSGFGRGLGALDLNSTKLKRGLSMLNPKLLDKESKAKIIQKFKTIISRGLKSVPEELISLDRAEFDNLVLRSFGLESFQEKIYSSLLEIYSIRQAVKK